MNVSLNQGPQKGKIIYDQILFSVLSSQIGIIAYACTNFSLFIKQAKYYVQKHQRLLLLKMNISEQTNSLQQPEKASNQTMKRSIRQKQDFALTEEQRLYIQYHLPRFFTLVPVNNTNARLNCTSKILLQESLTFIDRKRGRPQGSGRKANHKAILQRKSKRIAQTSKTKQLMLKDNQHSSFDYSNSSHREKQSNNKNEENYSLESDKCVQNVCLMQASLEQQMAKTCKQSQFDDEYTKNKEAIVNLQEDQLLSFLPLDQQPLNTKQILPQEDAVKKEDKQAQDKDKDNKTIIQTLKIQTIPENIIEVNQKQLKYTFQQQKMIIRRLKSHRQILPFLQPVDELRDGAPNYYKQILNPIDLQTIQFKLKTGIYKVSQQFHVDVRLMWANAKSYNRKNSHMQQVTQTLQNYYLNILSKNNPTAPKKKGSKK